MLSTKEYLWLEENNVRDISDVTQFKHALTNEVFLLTTSEKLQYIFKRLNREARSDEDRAEEILVQGVASKQGITTTVLAANNDYKLQEYAEGEIVSADMDELDNFLATQFHRIHQLPAIYAPKQRLYLELQRLKNQLPVSIDEKHFKKMLLLAKQLDESSACDTLCHGDLSLNNVLQGADNKVYIIDWEYAVIATPAYDLAFCICINHFSESQSSALISSYYLKLATPVDKSLQSLQKECDLYLTIFNYINELWAICFVDK